MAQLERLTKRRSLHTDTPKKVKSANVHIDEDEEDRITEVEKPDNDDNIDTGNYSDAVKEVVVQPRRSRPPRTYARNRVPEETTALLAARSATVSLETRNCGEGRISLGSAAVPLLALEENFTNNTDESLSNVNSNSMIGATKPWRKRGGRKRKDSEASKEKQTEEERIKLDEFMAQQKAFWDEVDDSSLVEEESS